MRYVLGFMFNNSRTRVALIRKNKPTWQAGRLNGIGGKIEEGESPTAAMVREFLEETGYETRPEQWEFFCQMEGTDGQWNVDVFAAVGDIERLQSITDEKVVVMMLSELHPRSLEIIENLSWLVPMALDSLTRSGPISARVVYS